MAQAPGGPRGPWRYCPARGAGLPFAHGPFLAGAGRRGSADRHTSRAFRFLAELVRHGAQAGLPREGMCPGPAQSRGFPARSHPLALRLRGGSPRVGDGPRAGACSTGRPFDGRPGRHGLCSRPARSCVGDCRRGHRAAALPRRPRKGAPRPPDRHPRVQVTR